MNSRKTGDKRQLLKSKYMESFDADTEGKLGEKKKTLKLLVEQRLKLEKIGSVFQRNR